MKKYYWKTVHHLLDITVFNLYVITGDMAVHIHIYSFTPTQKLDDQHHLS
jgi:hypothetical protein